MNTRTFTSPVSATFLTLLSMPLAAQQIAPEGNVNLPTVTVSGARPHDSVALDMSAKTGSRLGLTLRETPASVTLIGRELIEQRGAHDTQEILKGIPGVMVASPPGSAGTIAYRGFGTTSITQLFNGITVQYDAIAARPVDSWIVDRVEAIGGPSTFLFGAGAVGGSVNVVTKLPDRSQDFYEARAALGSYSTTQFAAGVNQRFGGDSSPRQTLRLDANTTHSNGWVDRNDRSARQLAVSWLSELTGTLSHTLALEHQKESVDSPYWGTPLLNPTGGQGRINPDTRFKNYNAKDGFLGQEVHWLRSITEYLPSDNTRATNTFYGYTALRDWRNVETYRFNATNTGVVRSDALLQRHDHELVGNRLEVEHKTKLADRPSTWAAGLDYSVNRQTRFPRSLSAVIDTVDPVNFTTGPFFSVPGMVPGFTPQRSNRVTTWALFVENQTRLTPDTALVTALRHDNILLEVTNHQTASPTNPAFFARRYQPTTGRIGVVHDITPGANMYVQLSTAADPPAGILTTASFSQVRNFDLTKGRQIEVGSKFDFDDGRGAATLAAYRITRKNLSTSDPANPGTTIPVGAQSSRGVEISASYRFRSALQLAGNLAYADAQFDDFTENVGGVAVSRVGNVPSNVPSTIANFWATYRFSPALQGGFDVRHVSRRYANSANTIWDGAYTVLGAHAEYRATDRTTITARVRNLTDRVYAAAVTGAPMFFLGAPRTFEVALQHRF